MEGVDIMKKVLFIGSVVFVICCAALFLFFKRVGNLDFFSCEYKIIKSFDLKNDSRKICLIESNCGATTPITIFVVVIDKDKQFSEKYFDKIIYASKMIEYPLDYRVEANNEITIITNADKMMKPNIKKINIDGIIVHYEYRNK